MNGNRSNNKWLGLIVALHVISLLTLWGASPSVSRAIADGIPDAGAQREQMIQESKATNDKLDKILTLLSGGDLKVTVRTPDDSNKR